jgi:hypothetical protein
VYQGQSLVWAAAWKITATQVEDFSAV